MPSAFDADAAEIDALLTEVLALKIALKIKEKKASIEREAARFAESIQQMKGLPPEQRNRLLYASQANNQARLTEATRQGSLAAKAAVAIRRELDAWLGA
jgi:hypothetical protein